MKSILLTFFFFCFTVSNFAQNEANIWYFGYNGGLDFNSGTPIVLLDGQLSTNEGCASISDSDGNLLFYTDGITVYNKNHSIMQNGTGLKGDSSSTHSAIIVPKPGTTNIYYVFTLDSLHLYGGGVNGLQFSEVNMSLNGDIGAVISKNNLLHTPVNEKVTAIKKPNSDEYWVVAHKYDSNEFITYNVSASGISSTAIVSSVGFIRSLRTTGQIKISPDGTKLAVAWTGIGVEVFNFNINTGKVVSLITDLNPPGNPYGIEFSPNSDLLYVSYYPGVSQYNLLAGAPIDIYNSGVVLQSSTREPYSSLQLGPDAKIYVAKSGRSYIDIIENPNVLGIGCNYKYNEMYLEGRRSGLGLPTFVSSLFYIEGITFENTCFGDTTKFLLSDVVDSAVWDFDDLSSGVNNTSTDIEPTHVFSNPGTYEVSVTATVGTDTAIETTTVTIYDLPQISLIVELKQCADDLDGFSAFNLDEVIPEITTNSANETISFFESQIDAENNNNPITSRKVYTNQTVSKDIVWARVENNNACYRTSQVNLIVTTTQIPNTFTKDFYVCDDNTDGISQFDFSSIHAEIEAMFPIGQQLIINYYRNEADALAEENPIMDTSNHRNIGYPNTQQVYIRVDGGLDNDCLGLGAYINLYVEPIPVANPVTIDRQCDDDQDGEFPFDVSLVESTIIGGQSLPNVTITYLDENNNLLQNPLPNPFFTTSQVVTVRVTNNNISDGSCFAETSLEFIVDKQPLANHVANQISCDDGADDTDGFHDFDTSQIESDVLNGQTGMEVHYYSESDIELPSPLPNPFASGTQTITVEVINPMNRSCIAKTDIVFIVDPLPDFSIDTPQVVCSSDPTFTVVLDPIETNLLEVYDYEWAYQDGTILSNAPTLTVFTPGTYSITLTKTDGSGCSRTRDIFVNTSEMAQINQNDISVVDNSNNNTIAINTSSLGQGDYEFSLDSEFSNYQDIPFFEKVSSGIHTLYVRDKKGCGTSLIDISVIGYPKVFTPNNDGYNDSWQIDGVVKLPESKILIYDRYGKLLKELASHSTGWDGTFNGNLMPSNDYWFIVNLSDGRTFKGHFSLIR